MTEVEVISKEFLEKALGKKVDSFTIKSHSDTGDNFMSILYTLDVNAISNDGKPETLHLLSKCYPNNAGRQEFLNDQNIFWKELQVYKSFIPELIDFQKDLGVEEILKPDFPPLAAGHAINFDEGHLPNENNNVEGKVFRPFDNYIMMVDLRKTWGFKMADRFVGLDFDHIALAVEAQAKLHALSWAYKKHKNIDDITKKFPALDFSFADEKSKKMMQMMIDSSIDEGIAALKSTVGEGSHLITAFDNLKEPAKKVMEIMYHIGDETDKDLPKYHRVYRNSVPAEETEIPWKVVLHGDTHMNNMLFRYNSTTNKPEQCILVDLQICRDSCPVTDLVYIIYTSTTTELRKKHLDDILKIYFEKFSHFCKVLKTETLPGFTLPELKRRFHRKKVIGVMMGAMCMPIFLKAREDAVQLDSLTEMSQEEIFCSIGKGMGSNTLYAKRITEFAQEMYDEGVL